MITSMEFKNYRKCRLWVNETGELPLTKVESAIDKAIPSYMKEVNGITQIALELSLPKNHSNYALVGFEYKPNITHLSTKITVFTSNERLSYSSTIMSDSYDKVFIGISEEYGQSVLESAFETLNEIGGFPAGEIIFNVGAHAECGSSKVIFAQTTKILLKLAKLDLFNMTKEEIQKEIESIL